MSNTIIDQDQLEKEIYEQFHQMATIWQQAEALNKEVQVRRELLAESLSRAPKHLWPRGYSAGWRKGRDKSSPEIALLEQQLNDRLERNKDENAARIYELTQDIWRAEQEIIALTETPEIAQLRTTIAEAYDNLPIRVKPFLSVRKFAINNYNSKLEAGEFDNG